MDALRASFGEKTRGILINSPNNPSGAVYSSDVLSEITNIILDKENEFGTEIFLINDEPYRKIIFDVVLLGLGNDGHIASLFKNNIDKKNKNIVAYVKKDD